jgi:pyruvate/2-oxoglutarate dehydrogenase complex dihydrolipoamide dehydrogenase (E3) component
MSDAPRVFPEDRHNQALVGNVHPPDWQNPVPRGRYNMVVIGAGTAGLVTAAGAAGVGARVALIEKGLMGGDCLNVGCVPSKGIIRSSRAFADAAGAGEFGVQVNGAVEVDFPAVMERMRRLRAKISSNDSALRYREELGVDVFLGEGRFSGPDSVEVDGRTLRFSKAVIATGARAFVPPIPGLEEAGFRTNETIFALTERPGRLAVIGAGPIGCEMAQAFRRLGSEVFLLNSHPQILVREDRDAAAIIEKVFDREGIRRVMPCATNRVEREGEVRRVYLECGGKERVLEVDEILIGVGRVPNVEGLGLEKAGVEYDRRRGVSVNDRLQTSNRKIYAAGDISSRYQFTHTADAAARVVVQNALFWGSKKYSSLTIPWCTYTDPEIAHVGMYEKDAAEKGVAVDTFTVDMSDVDRAVLEGEEEGMVRVHVKKGSDTILGATIVARHAGEMISEVSVAMEGRVGLNALSGVIHPYPTQAEAIRKAADAYRRTRLTPGVKRLFQFLLKLQRGG